MLGEVHPPDFFFDAHVYAADFDLEEVVGVFGVLVGHDLNRVCFEHLVLVCDVEHQNADVESLLQLVVGQVFSGNEVFVVDLRQFEDLVVAHFEVPALIVGFE